MNGKLHATVAVSQGKSPLYPLVIGDGWDSWSDLDHHVMKCLLLTDGNNSEPKRDYLD